MNEQILHQLTRIADALEGINNALRPGFEWDQDEKGNKVIYQKETQDTFYDMAHTALEHLTDLDLWPKTH